MAEPPAGLRLPGTATARADQRFGAGLLHALGAPAANAVFSPASIAAALRMALLGARGETADQMVSVLRLGGQEEAAEGLRLRSASLAELAAGPPAVSAPALMWVQSGLPLLPEFRQALADLGAGPRAADFRAGAGAARREINEVIREQTAGRIEDLLAPGSVGSLTRLVLANAVYLRAAWQHPFPQAATVRAPFHRADGSTVDVPMMWLTARLTYLRGSGYQAVSLPYEGGRLVMAVLLPDGAAGHLEHALAAGEVTMLAAGAAPEHMRLGLPRFRQVARFGLAGALGRLGMPAAFGQRADLSGITSSEPLSIGAVAHKAFINVDEQGTEAAAATATGIRVLSAQAPPDLAVVADRPFLFAILDAGDGTPLFFGRVADPAAG